MTQNRVQGYIWSVIGLCSYDIRNNEGRGEFYQLKRKADNTTYIPYITQTEFYDSFVINCFKKTKTNVLCHGTQPQHGYSYMHACLKGA